MFYKETEFKDTPIGKTPKQWELKRIRNVCKVVTGGTPSTKHPEYFGENIKWLKSGDIKQLYIYDTTEKLTQLGIENSNAKTYPSGSVAIALSGRGQTRGRTTITKAPMACNQSVAFMIPNSELLAEYLHYNLANRYMEIRNLTGHLDRSGLNLSIVSDILIPIPSLEEQRVVVGVLGVVDSAIELVDRVIWKTERLKKGLMQELLTRGIGHKEYKDTPIGKTPKTWQILQVGDLFSLEYGKGLPDRERIPGPYPVVGSNGVIGHHNQALVKGPGIVVGRKGTIGAVSWIDEDFWPIDTTYYVKLKTTNMSLKWLFHALAYLNPARFHLADVVPGLKRELVYSLKIGFPSLPEQEKIADVLSTIDRKLDLERKEKSKLERVKRGLMDLLLTGKVRVKVD